MRIFRLWRRVQMLLAAHLLGVVIIGMAQFATTSPVHPGSCFPIDTPGDRLWYWISSGLKSPLSDCFYNSEILRIEMTFAGIIISGIWLGLSVLSMRPFRLKPNLRLRSLMVLIALVPVEWTVGEKVWTGWERWDNYRILANYYAHGESDS